MLASEDRTMKLESTPLRLELDLNMDLHTELRAEMPAVMTRKLNTKRVQNGMQLKGNIKRIIHSKISMETSTKGHHSENQTSKVKQKQRKKLENSLLNLKGNKENIKKNNANMKSNGQAEGQMIHITNEEAIPIAIRLQCLIRSSASLEYFCLLMASFYYSNMHKLLKEVATTDKEKQTNTCANKPTTSTWLEQTLSLKCTPHRWPTLGKRCCLVLVSEACPNKFKLETNWHKQEGVA